MSSDPNVTQNLLEKFAQAKELQSQGNIAEAVAEYRAILEADNRNLAALHQIGQLSEQQGEFAVALEHYSRALELDPNPPFWVYRHFGYVLSQQEQFVEAIAAYQKAIALHPEDVSTYGLLGQAQGGSGDIDGAISSYQKQIELSSDLPVWVYLNLGDGLSQRSRLEEAIEAYQKALELEPENAGIRRLLERATTRKETEAKNPCFRAKQLQAQGKLEEALFEYRSVLEKDGNNLVALHQVAQICEGLGKWEEAVEGYQRAIQVDAESPFWVYRHLGFALSQVGDLDGAVEAYEKAVKLNPEDAATQSLLGQVLEKKGDLANTVIYNVEKKAFQQNLSTNVKHISGRLQASMACLTIVSKNYLPRARVLCETFLEYHPEALFFVFLVDTVDGYFDPTQEKFRLLTFDDVNFPSVYTFPYQYTILELNTAVKPFVLNDLLKKHDIDKLLYIDPDIQIFRNLSEVWDALETHSVVLTPHMRQPFWDNHSPSEVQILQSGTYNLGFLGIQNNQRVLDFLYWWMEKLYLDCVVDIPNGLFVDQKWMDLIPGYIPDTYILHDPSYNIAYWNLHERTLNKVNQQYLVDDRPLAFFHFSGYDPQKRDILSKHQSRHKLADFPELKTVCDQYAERLLYYNYLEAKDWPYAYNKLANGIKVTKSLNFVVRACLRKNIAFPNPLLEVDKFCEFLMTPSSLLSQTYSPPIVTAILHYRKDVAAYYPNARHNFTDSGFMSWLKNSGLREEKIQELYEKFSYCWDKSDLFEQIQKIIHKRQDVTTTYSELTRKIKPYEDFCNWLMTSGNSEESLKIDVVDLERFKKAKDGYYKVINLYYLRSDLQKAFCNIHSNSVRENFVNWLKENVNSLGNISLDEILWFDIVCQDRSHEVLCTNLFYNSWIRNVLGGEANLFLLEQIIQILGLDSNSQQVLEIIGFFTSDEAPSPLSQLHAYYTSQSRLMHLFPQAWESRKSLGALYEFIVDHHSIYGLASTNLEVRNWLSMLNMEIQSYAPDNLVINVAGYLDASTGMGQASRLILKALESNGVNYSPLVLPNTYTLENAYFEKPKKYLLMGFSQPYKGVNITIANADSVKGANEFLPTSYWHGKKNIGYWLWETEELPLSHAKAALYLDEIWTSSEYSAAAICKHISKPVKVVPLPIDIDELKGISSERKEFGLPTEQVLFGFFFDQKSILQRKNPYGLIQAFKKAFGDSNQACLVLKVNSPLPGNYDYEMLKLESSGLNVIWIEETFDWDKTLRLMNCLDVYVSLHRSEGFGLTLAEAMAMGKPVMATNYSGNLQFMNFSNSLLVDAKVVTTTRSYGAYPKGSRWAEPNLEQAADYMKLLLDRELRVKYGKMGQDSVSHQLSFKNIASIILELLQ